jgi:malate dehydrogenase (oxaloacetate-decarboxylating)(NADP+)
MDTKLNQEALLYHSNKQADKPEVISSKACGSPHDLSLTYTPGMAEACLIIKETYHKIKKHVR